MIQPYFAKMTISWAIVWVQKQHQVKSHRTVFTASNKRNRRADMGGNWVKETSIGGPMIPKLEVDP